MYVSIIRRERCLGVIDQFDIVNFQKKEVLFIRIKFIDKYNIKHYFAYLELISVNLLIVYSGNILVRKYS